MSVDYQAPSWTIEWLPGTLPGDVGLHTTLDGSWSAFPLLDGECRLLDVSWQRGRNDVLDGYQPGTATLILDNSDGELDEEDSGSSVYGYGAGTPIRLKITNPDTATTTVRFSGFLQLGWEPSSDPFSRARTVTVQLVDWLGWASQYDGPGSPLVYEQLYNVRLRVEASDTNVLWWRGPVSQRQMTSASAYGIVNGYASPVGFDFGYADNTHTIAAVESLGGFAPLPAFALYPGANLISDAQVAVSSPSTAIHGWVVFQMGTATNGRNMMISRLSSSGTVWFRFGVTSTGSGFATVNDNSGSPVALLSVAGSFDDEQTHWMYFQCSTSSGGAVTLTTDLGNDSDTLSGTPAITTTGGFPGYITTGAHSTSDDAATLCELMYAGAARVRLTTAPISTDPADGGIYSGGTFASALSRLRVALNTPTISQPSTATTITMGHWYPGSNYAATAQALANSVGGACFMTRGGKLYMRGFNDYLSGHSYTGDQAVEYNVKAQITDAATPYTFTYFTQPPTIRYLSRGRTGRRVDRVVNVIEAGEARLTATESRNAYGERTASYPGATDTSVGYATAVDWGSALIAARHDPTFDIGEVELRPYGDTDCTTFVCDDLELETKVTYTEQTPEGTRSLVGGLPVHVQGESFSWSRGTDWTVKLKLAVPIPDEA